LVANMTANGTLALYGSGITSGDHRIGTASYFSATLNVAARSATEKGVVVRGFASQTANLQEWQNDTGTLLAKVDSNGVVYGATVRTANSNVALLERNAGGELSLAKQTAATTNPGTGYGRIYLRDGTNAGTLKLVIRAGAAGAETTILDNIPQ